MGVVTADEVRELIKELPQWIETYPELRQKLAEIVAREDEEPPAKMTYEEFLTWADEDTLAEWVDGEVIMYTPASDRHQDLTRFLMSVLGIYVETRDLGVIRPAPFQMKLKRGREPGLLFVAHEHRERLKDTHLDGPADLVVEIVSSDSVAHDRGRSSMSTKLAGYRSTGCSILIGVGPNSTAWERQVSTKWSSIVGKVCTTRRWCPVSGCEWSGCGRNHCPIPYRCWARSLAWTRRRSSSSCKR